MGWKFSAEDGHTIDNRHIVPGIVRAGFLINIPQRIFFLQTGPNGSRLFASLRRPDWSIPTGTFAVVVKEENPVGRAEIDEEKMLREGKMIEEHMPPCPENPLGHGAA